jgi:hypothetical protein
MFLSNFLNRQAREKCKGTLFKIFASFKFFAVKAFMNVESHHA